MIDELADRLASLLPEDERAEARAVLAERVLPVALAGIGDHPRPERLAEVVYEELSERLTGGVDVEQLGDEAEIRGLAAHAQSLAVARYLSEDPNAVGRAGPFLDADAQTWRTREPEEIAAEAERTRDALEAWAENADPELRETRRPDYLHAKLALGSAASGTFGTAAGPLYDFLKRMGTARDRLDIS